MTTVDFFENRRRSMKHLYQIDLQELGTILAALRFYQVGVFRNHGRVTVQDSVAGEIMGIAMDAEGTALDDRQIDALCERLNVGNPPRIGLGINVEGGIVQAVFTDTEGVSFDCVVVDYDIGNGPELTEVDQGDGTTELAHVDTMPVAVVPSDYDAYTRARDERDLREQPVAV